MKKYLSEQIDYINNIPEFKHSSLQNELYSYFLPKRDEQENIIEDSPVIVYATGITFPDKNYFIKREGRPYYVLEYVCDGVGHVKINEKHHVVKKGDVYILEPNTAHHYYSDKEHPYTKMWINFDSEIFTKVFKGLNLENINHFAEIDCEDLFRNIINLDRISPFNVDIAHDALEILLSIASRLSKSLSKEQDIPETVYKIKRLLDSSLYGNISIEEICEKLFVSRSFVIKKFKEYYGITPHKYVMQAKLKLACHLIKNKNSSIKEIADTLGFFDEYHFSNTFKNTHKLSPTAYREKHSKK